LFSVIPESYLGLAIGIDMSELPLSCQSASTTDIHTPCIFRCLWRPVTPSSILSFVAVAIIKSSQIDELGNWCLEGSWGAEFISCRRGIHGNPGSGNHPQKQPLTSTVTLNESVETTNLTHVLTVYMYLEASNH